jgi:hypothetical protein
VVPNREVYLGKRDDVTTLTVAKRLLRDFFLTEKSRSVHVCSHHPPRGIVAKRSGSSPTRKSPIFFFTKRLNSLKLRATYDTGVLSQASNSFEFLAEAESFWELHSAISAGKGDHGPEENCSLFENFAPPFPQKMLKGGIFNKEELSSRPGSRDSHLRLGFPVGKWPSVRFAIQLKNKTS